MEENKKKNIKAGLITIIVHILLFIILALLSITAAERDKHLDEDGVPVLLGMAEDAGGEDLGGLPSDVADNETEETDEGDVEEVPIAPSPTPQPVPKPDPKPAPKPVITQNTEKSITAEEAKKKAEEEATKKKAEEEAARKRAAEEAAKKRAEEEAARKKAAEEKAAAAANNRVTGAFGNASNKSSSGNTTGNGSQGSPNGNSNVGATTGTGGLGTGTSAKVGNRTVVYLAKPTYADSNSEGTVVVSIQVNPSGAVVIANVTSSTTSSAALKNAAIAAAKQSKFSEGTTTESGTITYRFKLQ